MPAKFYVALKGTEVSVHAAWEECKQLQKKQGGYTFRSFTSSKDAVDWVTSKGGSLNEEDIPSYNDVSITINEEISPFARQNIIIKEE